MLRDAIIGFDHWMQGVNGIFEFCDDERCLFRAQRAKSPRNMRLSDGTQVARGQPVLMFHFWNEHLLPIGEDGAGMRWAAAMSRALLLSLRELACFVDSDPRAKEVTAIFASTVLVPLGRDSGPLHLLQRVGFDVLPEPAGRLGAFGRFWENLYTWALMWAYNSASLRSKSLPDLDRTELWMSRQQLLARHL